MRIILTLAALVALAVGSHAECRFGHNRHSIETVDRHIMPSGTVVGCDQRDMSVTTPPGRQHTMQAWTFTPRK